MNFADVSDTANSLATLGVPGLVVIVLASVGVIVWQNKKIDNIYEKRQQDMRDVLEKYGQFSTQIALLIQKVTDTAPSGSRRR